MRRQSEPTRSPAPVLSSCEASFYSPTQLRASESAVQEALQACPSANFGL